MQPGSVHARAGRRIPYIYRVHAPARGEKGTIAFAFETELFPGHGQDCLTSSLISFGDAKTTEARSPCIPAPTATGFPGSGPSLLESVLNRRLNSQIFWTLPSAVVTV